jgi:hypothetical protein
LAECAQSDLAVPGLGSRAEILLLALGKGAAVVQQVDPEGVLRIIHLCRGEHRDFQDRIVLVIGRDQDVDSRDV